MPAILGKKVGMTSVYDDQGRQVPVTVIEAGPCHVLQVKSADSDGYNAIQIGYEDVPAGRAKKPDRGHAKKAGAETKKHVREYRTDEIDEFELGAEIDVNAFEGVEMVDVTGTTKGRGFAGGMKRHGFGGQPATHGTKRVHRSGGSVGEGGGIPGRAIRKGKRMAGHMGHVRRTAEKLKLIKVDPEANLLVVKGSVPGPNGGLLFVRSARKVGAKK